MKNAAAKKNTLSAVAAGLSAAEAFAILKSALRLVPNAQGKYAGKTAAEWRKEVNAQQAEREASFQRCDTDGFVSQWAHGICASRDDRKAECAKTNGQELFTVLVDAKTGERVDAKLVDGQWGTSWMLAPEAKACYGGKTWVTCGKGSRIQRELGLKEVAEWADAYITLGGSGTGLSGTAYPITLRAREPAQPAELVPYTTHELVDLACVAMPDAAEEIREKMKPLGDGRAYFRELVRELACGRGLLG